MKDKKKKKKKRQVENLKKLVQEKARDKKEKEKRNPARLKTQKGGLGKNQGQRKEEEEKKKIEKSYQVGNLRMQTKKRRILQDESLEV